MRQDVIDTHGTIGRRFNKVFGTFFILIGIMGYIPVLVPNSRLLGIFMVDSVHNMVHLLTGLILLAVGVTSTEHTAKMTALIFGVIYGIVTIMGFATGHVLNLFPVNVADNILHLIVAVTALGVGLMKERTTFTTH